MIKKIKNSSEKYAFSLAEVLIALGIIGVVAALTIPALIGYNEKEETVSKLKNIYSTVSQAIDKATIENGQYKYWDYLNLVWYKREPVDFVNKYLAPNIKGLEYYADGGSGQTLSLCGVTYKWILDGRVEDYWTTGNYKWASFVMPNGMCMGVLREGSAEVQILVDINGPKKPNIVGYDFFMFIIETETGKLKPRGYDKPYSQIQADHGSGCTLSSTKQYCAAKIMYDGWRIAPDYPWHQTK